MLDVQALPSHNAGIMKKKRLQYTIRDVPSLVDRRLRETAAQYGNSLNAAALGAISKGLGVDFPPVAHHDLDDLAGTWVQDPEFDKAMNAMDRIDPEQWQ